MVGARGMEWHEAYSTGPAQRLLWQNLVNVFPGAPLCCGDWLGGGGGTLQDLGTVPELLA